MQHHHHHNKSQSTNKHHAPTTTNHTQQLYQKSSTRSTRHLRCKALKLCRWTMGITTATPPPSTQIAIKKQAQHINRNQPHTTTRSNSAARPPGHVRCKAMKRCKWAMGTTNTAPPPSQQIAINKQAPHINRNQPHTTTQSKKFDPVYKTFKM